MKLETLKSGLKGFIHVLSDRNYHEGTFENGTICISYSTIIVIKLNGKIYLTQSYDYSNTTNKHRCRFLDENIQETRKKLASGEYTLLQERGV